MVFHQRGSERGGTPCATEKTSVREGAKSMPRWELNGATKCEDLEKSAILRESCT